MIYNTDTATDKRLPFVMWDDKLQDATLGGLSQNGLFPVEAVIDDSTASRWFMPYSGSPIWSVFTADFGVPTDLNCITMLTSRKGGQDVTLRISTSDDGSSWTDIAPPYVTFSEGIIAACFKKVSARHVRIVFTFTNSADGLYILRIMAGTRLVFPRGVIPPYTPIVDNPKIETRPRMSMTGQYLKSKVTRMGVSQTARIGRVEEAYFLSHVLPFKTYFEAMGTFFWASKGVDSWRDLCYCWSDGNAMGAAYQTKTDFRNLTLGLQGYAG